MRFYFLLCLAAVLAPAAGVYAGSAPTAPAQASPPADDAERLRRREALRSALRAQGEALQDTPAPRQRTPQDRAALRQQLREQPKAPDR